MNPIQSTVNTSANAATATGTITGTVTATAKASNWLDENSLAIGAACAVLSLILALIFHLINTRQNAKFAMQRANIEKAQLIAKWTDEGKPPEQINSYLKLAEIEDAS